MFNQSLLPPTIVYYCLKTLLCKTEERFLEYVCNLLKIAGKKLNEQVKSKV